MLWLTSPGLVAETGRVVALVVVVVDIWGWKAFGRPPLVEVEVVEGWSATAEVGWDRSGESTTLNVRELASKVPSPALTSDSLEEKDDSDSLMVEPPEEEEENMELTIDFAEKSKKTPYGLFYTYLRNKLIFLLHY